MRHSLVDEPRAHCALRFTNLEHEMRARYDRYRAAAETKVQFLPRQSETQEWTTVSAAKMAELAPRITIVNFKLLKAVGIDGRRKVEFRVAVQGVDRIVARVDAATGEAFPAAQRLWQWVSNIGYTKLSAVHKHVKKYPLRYQIDARATPIPPPPPQRFLSKSYSPEATRQRQRVFGRMLKIVSDARSASEQTLAQPLPDALRALIIGAASGGAKTRLLDERETLTG